jgi:hypothetical protein
MKKFHKKPAAITGFSQQNLGRKQWETDDIDLDLAPLCELGNQCLDVALLLRPARQAQLCEQTNVRDNNDIFSKARVVTWTYGCVTLVHSTAGMSWLTMMLRQSMP